ncbi:MAG: hypothetical protein K2X82_28920, partial [Gemmataceae bacterium]|nr:hypothetical protein [Gemmataceae bacterium]
VPDNPAAWLLTAARRRLTDAGRQARRHADALAALVPSDRPTDPPDDPIPDDRLKLLFVCTHPAIDPAARTPLMLQAVLGLDAGRVGSAFLVAPTAVAFTPGRPATPARRVVAGHDLSTSTTPSGR